MKLSPSIRGCSLISFLMILSVSTAQASGSTSTSGPVGPVATDACVGFGADWVKIRTEADLRNISDPAGKYVLCNDITLSAPWVTKFPAQRFEDPRFIGIFEGQGKKISNLEVLLERSGTSPTSGFFGRIWTGGVVQNVTFRDTKINFSEPSESDVSLGSVGIVAGSCTVGKIKNIRIHGASIDLTGADYATVGGIVGGTNKCEIENVTLVGSVTIAGKQTVGGIVGYAHRDTAIYNASIVDGEFHVGASDGFVGGIAGVVTNGSSISGSYSYADVDTLGSLDNAGSVGGLVGALYSGSVFDSQSFGTVRAGQVAGGLVGHVSSHFGPSYIENSFATGSVNSLSVAGGLVGDMGSYLHIPDVSVSYLQNSYATGSVTSLAGAGGLVGRSRHSLIENSYSTSLVTGNRHLGGLVGELGENSVVRKTYFSGSVGGAFYRPTCVGGIAGAIQKTGSYGVDHTDFSETSGSSGFTSVFVANSFYLNFLAGTGGQSYCSTGGVSALAADMTNMNTFKNANWSISNRLSGSTTWQINSASGIRFPTLRSNPQFVSNQTNCFNFSDPICF